jgi:hypothetical protein
MNSATGGANGLMPRKLKTYTTSVGFFDLAVAAPSMQAALRAWGSTNDLFHQGFAKVSEDPEVVEATMAKPGIVLRRPVGTEAPFSEEESLPRNLANVLEGPAHKRKLKHSSARIDEKTAREAAARYEREQKERELDARREEAAQKKRRERRERAAAVAKAALDKASRAHERKANDLEKARTALERKLEAEHERWKGEKEHLEQALQRARNDT